MSGFLFFWLRKGQILDPQIFLTYSGDLKSVHLKSGLFEGRISNGPVFEWSGFSFGFGYSPNYSKTRPFEIQMFLSGFQMVSGYSPNYSKTRPFKIQMFLSGFQMVSEKMAAICPDFKWLGSRISDPIQNPDY